MNRVLNVIFFVFIGFVALPVFSQESGSAVIGGEYKYGLNETPCLTNEQRNSIKENLHQNVALLRANNTLVAKSSLVVSFTWPVRQATGFTYNEVWAISNYVDHNAAYPNLLSDYNCGTKTYDVSGGYNHQGIDIYTWPFSWKQFENNQSEVIAAAAGQIIGKFDGNYDKNCSLGGGNWNAVYVKHSDGSVAWYGHMKNGTLTSKIVGDTVSQGEFLGVIGSSGNSTGPHLHFEVYTNDSYTNLVDPYAGACNGLNASSWWQVQKPYVDPNVNAALTHSAPPVFNTCPTTETSNESDQFDLNDTVYFGTYLRDQVSGTVMNVKMIRPNGTYLGNYNKTFTSNYGSSYWYWSNQVDVEGVWKWEVSYQGKIVTHEFNVGTLSIEDSKIQKMDVYPNPFSNKISFTNDKLIVKATVYNLLGSKVLVVRSESGHLKELNLGNLNDGIYLLTLETESGRKKTIKIIK